MGRSESGAQGGLREANSIQISWFRKALKPAGGYESVNDAIVRALEVLRAEDGLLHDRRDEIDSKIDRALAQFERGEFFPAEKARADMEQRKADWLRDHSG